MEATVISDDQRQRVVAAVPPKILIAPEILSFIAPKI